MFQQPRQQQGTPLVALQLLRGNSFLSTAFAVMATGQRRTL
jgi:hypothetical protein